VLAFTGVFAVSAALPGPDTMLLFSRALGSGARAAVTVAVGLVLGKLALLTAAVLGVAAAAAALGPMFVVLKLAGGVYLMWLAVGLWRRAAADAPPAEQAASRSRLAGVVVGWRGVGLGALLTISNPQALMFYIAVLPAVLGGHVSLSKYLLLCAALITVMAAVAAAYITLATRVRVAINTSRRRIADRVGAVLLGAAGATVVAR
jgi:threonine/homoserine/homoserine lactone efflux protein